MTGRVDQFVGSRRDTGPVRPLPPETDPLGGYFFAPGLSPQPDCTFVGGPKRAISTCLLLLMAIHHAADHLRDVKPFEICAVRTPT
jgi:hypothetical protein